MDNQLKLTLLRRTLEVLGPTGENWTQGSYFQNADSSYIGYDDGNVRAEPAKFCLAGALCQAAWLLGHIKFRNGGTADALTGDVSLVRLVNEMEYPAVADFNDDQNTSWDDVKSLVETRISQLEGQTNG